MGEILQICLKSLKRKGKICHSKYVIIIICLYVGRLGNNDIHERAYVGLWVLLILPFFLFDQQDLTGKIPTTCTTLSFYTTPSFTLSSFGDIHKMLEFPHISTIDVRKILSITFHLLPHPPGPHHSLF